jgi:hypothetical protein
VLKLAVVDGDGSSMPASQVRIDTRVPGLVNPISGHQDLARSWLRLLSSFCIAKEMEQGYGAGLWGVWRVMEQGYGAGEMEQGYASFGNGREWKQDA